MALVVVGNAVGIVLIQQAAVGIVVSVFLGLGEGPVVAVVGFNVEIAAHGLSVSHAPEEGVGMTLLLYALVGDLVAGPVVFGDVIRIDVGLVERAELIVGETVSSHHGEGPAGLSEPLAQEGETAGAEILVGTEVTRIAPVDVFDGRVAVIVGQVAVDLVESAASEIDLGLEEDGSIVRELVVQAHTETMPPGLGVIGAV